MTQFRKCKKTMKTVDGFKNEASLTNKGNFFTTQKYSKLYKMTMITVLAIFIAGTSNAQTEPNTGREELKTSPAQVSIFFPLGTHGRQSVNYEYNFSLNLLTGRVGGVNGMEVSGLFGRVERGVNGMQVAGLGNIVGDGVKGMQVSGLANVVGDEMKGIQVTGLANVIGDEVKGIQVSGLANVVGDEMKGIQVSGLANVVGDEAKGIQVSGLANIVGDAMKGIQVSGLASVVGDEMKGIQISGLANVVGDEVKGIQVAGISNRSDIVTGLQIGGIYNRSKTLRGLQIGIVSINDTIEKGASLSLVNIVKRGFYREWELSFSDYSNVAVSYKMGTQKFYTIYTAGANFVEDNLWTVGIGFGNRTPLGSRFDFRPELVSYNYYPMNFKNVQSTFATHLKFGFVYNISEKFGLSLAPSVYVMNSNRKSGSEHYKVSLFDAFYTHEKNDRLTTIGIGISLGLSIR